MKGIKMRLLGVALAAAPALLGATCVSAIEDSGRPDGGTPDSGVARGTWRPMSTAGEVTGYGTAVWTGSEMISWAPGSGGTCGGIVPYPATGGRYDPATDTWARVASDGAPENGGAFSAV